MDAVVSGDGDEGLAGADVVVAPSRWMLDKCGSITAWRTGDPQMARRYLQRARSPGLFDPDAWDQRSRSRCSRLDPMPGIEGTERRPDAGERRSVRRYASSQTGRRGSKKHPA